MMDIIEKRAEWGETFEAGWLAHLRSTGEVDWKPYKRVRNKSVPPGKAIDLSQSRLMLVSTAGGFLKDEQEAFDTEDLFGEYTLRMFPTSTALDAIGFEHGHYDPTMVEADPQVALPLRHLEAMVAEGIIGELAPSVVNTMGYQPDARRVVDETIPPILEIARAEQVDAVLLVPV